MAAAKRRREADMTWDPRDEKDKSVGVGLHASQAFYRGFPTPFSMLPRTYLIQILTNAA